MCITCNSSKILKEIAVRFLFGSSVYEVVLHFKRIFIINECKLVNDTDKYIEDFIRSCVRSIGEDKTIHSKILQLGNLQ